MENSDTVSVIVLDVPLGSVFAETVPAGFCRVNPEPSMVVTATFSE